eukprot:jgi/Mesvir1/10898/Mv08608-RA.1
MRNAEHGGLGTRLVMMKPVQRRPISGSSSKGGALTSKPPSMLLPGGSPLSAQKGALDRINRQNISSPAEPGSPSGSSPSSPYLRFPKQNSSNATNEVRGSTGNRTGAEPSGLSRHESPARDPAAQSEFTRPEVEEMLMVIRPASSGGASESTGQGPPGALAVLDGNAAENVEIPTSNDANDYTGNIDDVLGELSRLETQANIQAADLPAAHAKRSVGKAAGDSSDLELELQRSKEKLAMAQSILRKLYRKNVQLEKEIQILSCQKSTGGDMPLYGGGATSSPIMTALQERDRTIADLQKLVAALRVELEKLRRGATAKGADPSGGMMDVLQRMQAETTASITGYKKIRNDYNRLLTRRVEAMSMSRGPSKEAKDLLVSMKERLTREMAEREQESALFNAKLYETEQKSADGYVEKRLLEHKVAKLEKELQERDTLDAQIETCVCSLFEKMTELEKTNQSLMARLSASTPSSSIDGAQETPSTVPSL